MAQNAAQQLSADLRRFRRYLILGNLLLLALIALAALLTMSASYRAQEERGRASAVDLARTLSLRVAATIQLVDNSLLSTRNQVDRLRAAGPLPAGELTRIADAQHALVPFLAALRITDADGYVLNPDVDGPSGVSMADRDYFKAARADPTRLAISEPLQGRLKKGWGLVLARARLDEAGRFIGVVYAGIGTEGLVQDFRLTDVGSQGTVVLRSTSLRMIARHAPNDRNPEARLGLAQVSDAFHAALKVNPTQGSYVARSMLDGVERVAAYTQVGQHPLLIQVGLATDDFFAAWWRQMAQLGGLLLLLAAMVVAASAVIYRAQARQVRARAQISALAAERGALLDNELVGMVKLHERQEVWHNAALARLFGYEPGELSGMPSRLLYLDDESHVQVGLGYQRLAATNSYRSQLRMRRKDGSPIWIDLSGSALPDGESLWLMTDITAIKHSEEQARHLAFHDMLTGLPNRHLLLERLAFLLRDAQRNDRWLAICYLDLDGFKTINDTLGHDAGDALLRGTAARLSASMRGNDVVARIGGDEFVLVLNQLSGLYDEQHALNRLLDAFEAPIALPGGAEAQVGISIGVAMYPRHSRDAATLLTLADRAMLAGKRAGKGRWVMHDESSQAGGA